MGVGFRIVVQPAAVEVTAEDDVIELLHRTLGEEFCLEAGGPKCALEIQLKSVFWAVLRIAARVPVNSNPAGARKPSGAIGHE